MIEKQGKIFAQEVIGGSFVSEIFIEEILEEVVDADPTGRLIIKGLLPVEYSSEVDTIEFIVPKRTC